MTHTIEHTLPRHTKACLAAGNNLECPACYKGGNVDNALKAIAEMKTDENTNYAQLTALMQAIARTTIEQQPKA